MSTASETPHDTEAERIRLANELASDSGPGWADGFRPGTPGCHELMDRASMLTEMLERHLLTHPACVAEPEWYALADRAATALRELYQRVGAEHLTTDAEATSQQREPASQQQAPSRSEAATPPEIEGAVVQNNDVELVAIWLHGAARSAGQADLVRKIVSQAARDAGEMYSLPTDQQTTEDDEGDHGAREAIARFAHKWDECERIAREDEATD